MDAGVLVVISLAFLVPGTWQAPGDVDALCLAARLSDLYPRNWRVLMDSYNYENLIGPEGDDSVWQTLDVGGQGQGWSQTSITCQRSVQVCDVTVESQSRPEYWIVTQAISFLTARAIIVELAYEFTDCNDIPGCSVTSFTISVYETNEGTDIEISDRSNFELVFTIENTQDSPVNFSFSPSGNFSMFHLGIVDTGACISVRRLIVYYEVIPSTEVGLVFIPEVALPSVGSSPVSVLAVCAENSTNVTSLEVLCDGNGECSGTPMCACDSGFEFIDVISQCRACATGTVKTATSNNETCVRIAEVTIIQYVTNTVPVAVLGALLGAMTVVSISCLLILIFTVWCLKKNIRNGSQVGGIHIEQQANEPYNETSMMDMNGVTGVVPTTAAINEQPGSTATQSRDEIPMPDVNGVARTGQVVSPTADEDSTSAAVGDQLITASLSAEETSLTGLGEPTPTSHTDEVGNETKPEIEVVCKVSPAQAAKSSNSTVQQQSTNSGTGQQQSTNSGTGQQQSTGSCNIQQKNTDSGTIQQQSGGIRSLVSRASRGLVSVLLPSYRRSDSSRSSDDPSAVNEGGGFSLV